MLDSAFVAVINSISLVCLGFFIKMWMNGVNSKLKELTDKIENNITDDLCKERQSVLSRDILRLERSVYTSKIEGIS